MTEVDRAADLKKIEAGVKNKFKWNWLEEVDDEGDHLSDYIRKVDVGGQCKCIICNVIIRYGSSGKKAFVGSNSHSNSKSHKAMRKLKHTNETLPAVFRARKEMEYGAQTKPCTLPYGAPSNVHHLAQCSGLKHAEQPNVSFQDRKSNSEAMLVSFVAEHSLPFSITPHLIELSKELSNDLKVLKDMSMERTTCSYKLTEGIACVTHKRIVENMKTRPFSINLDECTNNSNERVLSILVSYFSDTQGQCVVQHYASIAMTTVNANTVFSAIKNLFVADNIPFKNVVSSLSDSAAYMRGRVSGFESKLRQEAPHLLDIDGDVCHHVHNSVKKFCEHFDHIVEKLADDLYTDFKWSPDLRAELKDICVNLGVNFYVPLERVPHRWLSCYDAAFRIKTMVEPLKCMYYAFIDAKVRKNYKKEYQNILKAHGVSNAGKARLWCIVEKLNKKALTPKGLDRKKRIVSKMFLKYQETKAYVELYCAVLPLFKSFVLLFEQKEPLVHRLFDELTDMFRSFLACFVRHEQLAGMNASKLAKLIIEPQIMCKLSQIFIGHSTEQILLKMKPEFVQKFLKQVQTAYLLVAKYMQGKLPLTNKVLRLLSALDPKAKGHSLTYEYLKKLPDAMNIHLDDADAYMLQMSKLQLDGEMPEYTLGSRLDKWWAAAMTKYPAIRKPIIAALSIFTGPRIEQSFSIMNHVVTKKTNRLDVETFSAIQTVKYDLMNSGESAIQRYRRENKLKSPVDSSVCYHMRTAYGRHKRKKQSSEASVPRKKQKLTNSKNTNVHRLAQQAKRRIFLQHQQVLKKRRSK